MNEANMKAMQTQINNVKNELRNEMKNLIQASMSNQTSELKNTMASYFQMNTVSTSGSGSLPSNTIANPKAELKAITTRSGIVLDGPSVPIPPPFINPEEDERVEETLTDQDLAEYTIKKMLKALLSNKEKLLELANIPLNENCSVVILKNLHEKLGDPGKFLIPCGFSELKCKALADLCASINLMPLSVWKKLVPLLLLQTICLRRDDELALITFLLGNDDLRFDIESDLKEIEYLLHHDSILKDSIDQSNLANLNDNLVDTMPEMFTDEHAPDYSSPPLYDEYDDDLFKVESDTDYVYDDPFDFKGEKIKELKLLIDELDLPNYFLPSFEYDSFLSEEFSKVDNLPSTNNEDKVFNPGILIQKNLFEIITYVTLDKNEKKLAISHAFLILEDFDPPLYELSFFKEVPRNSQILKTHAGFCPSVFTFPASIGNHVSKSNRTNVYLLAYLLNGLRFTLEILLKH
uniref:Reverse transcriptase domain-containing protein n=1 Tax=Tanacetum cinerariifolium TaxID=118510 RepID=A0A699HQW3_TANCI|nr:reverse transcriptase domain-containing protein [Tanacetum cinerariifolium]